MKKTFTGTCVAAFAAVAMTAAAQQPAPQTPAPQPTPAPSASVKLDKDVKITGCVKAGAEAGSYELTNVKKDSAAGVGAAASAGAAGATASASTMSDSKNVKISPAAGVDLAAHVGHTVELMGSWSAGASASPAGEARAAKTFNATSVKMVSATCTTGTN